MVQSNLEPNGWLYTKDSLIQALDLMLDRKRQCVLVTSGQESNFAEMYLTEKGYAYTTEEMEDKTVVIS